MLINHNLMAMNAYRQLNITSNSKKKTTEKLSAGYKINRAADDAAGLAISEKMRKQIRGLSQASDNAQDGVSAVQTAEGAMAEVHDMLQRVNELSVKAANGTNSVSDRGDIQKEIDQILKEIDRVGETTKFNENYLLKGDAVNSGFKEITLQPHDAGLNGIITSNSDGTVSFDIGKIKRGDTYKYGDVTYMLTDDINAVNYSTSDIYAKGPLVSVNGGSLYFEGNCDLAEAKLAIKGIYNNSENHAEFGDYITISATWGSSTYTFDGKNWINKNGEKTSCDAILSIFEAPQNPFEVLSGRGSTFLISGQSKVVHGMDEVASRIKNAYYNLDGIGIKAGDTIKIQNHNTGFDDSINTYDGSKWIDANGKETTYEDIVSNLKGWGNVEIDRHNAIDEAYFVGGEVTFPSDANISSINDIKSQIKNAFYMLDGIDSYYMHIGGRDYTYNNDRWENRNGEEVTYEQITSNIEPGGSIHIARRDSHINDYYAIAGGEDKAIYSAEEIKDKIKNAFYSLDGAGLRDGDRIAIGGRGYTYDNGAWKNINGEKVTYEQITSNVEPGEWLELGRPGGRMDYLVGGVVRLGRSISEIKDKIKNAYYSLDGAGLVDGASIRIIGGREGYIEIDNKYHYDNGNWKNEKDEKVTYEQIISDLEPGDSVIIDRRHGSKMGNDSQEYMVELPKKNTGIPISPDEFVKKIANDLLQANSIGTQNTGASVEFDGNKGKFLITLGTVRVPKENELKLHVGADATKNNQIRVNIETISSQSLGIANLNIVDDSGNSARYALDAISDAISKVSEQRSNLGAIQNRLEHTIKNLDNVVENTTAAESQIRDTDMAKEMVKMSMQNILEQVGQSMLGQANQANQNVLSLLS